LKYLEIYDFMDAMSHSTDSLLETMYSELRRIARNKLIGERADHTLEATALVHEVVLKLGDQPNLPGWESRSHFLRTAAEAMRRILVDHARARLAAKRGGRQPREQFYDIPVELPLPSEEIVAVHECLDRFAEEDPVKAELVKLRIFAGLSHQEAAAELGLSRQTADRYWAYAKVRLYSMLE
jgi:RNA polymerase sigma factor (TIGR02999 family)